MLENVSNGHLQYTFVFLPPVWSVKARMRQVKAGVSVAVQTFFLEKGDVLPTVDTKFIWKSTMPEVMLQDNQDSDDSRDSTNWPSIIIIFTHNVEPSDGCHLRLCASTLSRLFCTAATHKAHEDYNRDFAQNVS